MRPDRDEDWAVRIKGLSSQREREPTLQAIRRAALSASQVTGDAHWDHFLSIVKDRIEAKEKELSVAVDLLKNSENFTTSDLINQKLAVRLVAREIDVLNWVIELPSSIMEQGDRASKLLGKIEESTH